MWKTGFLYFVENLLRSGAFHGGLVGRRNIMTATKTGGIEFEVYLRKIKRNTQHRKKWIEICMQIPKAFH